MDFPFTDAEQRFVLAEAIKTSSIPVEKLISFIDDGNVQPAWTQMLLPLGRNLKSCMDAWNALRLQAPQSYTPSHLAHYGPTAPPGMPIVTTPHKRKPPSESGENFAAAHAPKRRQSAGDTTTGTQRVIQPKPSSNGQSPPLFSSPPGQPKKRGRPSKAEVEARNADLVARGHVLPPPKTSTPRSKPPELAPREPELLQQRDATFFHSRPSLPPILGPRIVEGPASETGTAYENRPVQAGPLDPDALDQSGKKKRRAPPKQSPKDAGPNEANPAAPVGPQPQLRSYEARPPISAPVPVLVPRPSDRPSPVIVEAPPVPAAPAAETSAKETTGASTEPGK